jgi:hypothetical protein
MQYLVHNASYLMLVPNSFEFEDPYRALPIMMPKGSHLVPKVGVEPTRLIRQRGLSPPCLPFHHFGINRPESSVDFHLTPAWKARCLSTLLRSSRPSYMRIHAVDYWRRRSRTLIHGVKARCLAFRRFSKEGLLLIVVPKVITFP